MGVRNVLNFVNRLGFLLDHVPVGKPEQAVLVLAAAPRFESMLLWLLPRVWKCLSV